MIAIDPMRLDEKAREKFFEPFALSNETFDKLDVFVLDIVLFSTIIYIWYEDGELRPFLVR